MEWQQTNNLSRAPYQGTSAHATSSILTPDTPCHTQNSNAKRESGMSNFLAASVAWAEFLTLAGLGVYALSPIIWEMTQ
jgi:hypothetical protein